MSDVVALDQYRKMSTKLTNSGSTTGIVREFTQALNICTLCGSSAHRASKCPLRAAPDNS